MRNSFLAPKTNESIDLLRTYYYDCLPYQSNPPTTEEKTRFGEKQKFFERLRSIPRLTVREGRLRFKGLDSNGKPIFEQKRVDLLLGLDFTLLSANKQLRLPLNTQGILTKKTGIWEFWAQVGGKPGSVPDDGFPLVGRWSFI